MRTAAERRAGYPRDLNSLVKQAFFRCVACNGLFNVSRNGAHHQQHCADCLVTWKREQKRALLAVRGAVIAGLLPPVTTLRCVDCDFPASIYDHRDYSRPIDVVPVCASCNQRRGPAKFPVPA